MLLNPRFEYSRILCKSGLTEINFRSKPMLSHVVQHFSRMLSCVLVACSPDLHFSQFVQTAENPTHHIRARNPRFYFVHAGTKPSFLTKMGHQKSGIPCSASYVATIFCNHLAKLLQKIIASHKQIHHMLLLSFVIILQSCYKRIVASQKTNTSHVMAISQTFQPRFVVYNFREFVKSRFVQNGVSCRRLVCYDLL